MTVHGRICALLHSILKELCEGPAGLLPFGIRIDGSASFTDCFPNMRYGLYLLHHKNTRQCSCCDNPSLDTYFNSDFSYYIFRMNWQKS